MGETCGSPANRLSEQFRGCVGVAEADFHSQRDGALDCGQSVEAFRCECEQERVVSGRLAQFTQMIGCRMAHQLRIVRATKARLGGEERAFNVPSSDGPTKFWRLFAQRTQVSKSRDEARPLIRDQ